MYIYIHIYTHIYIYIYNIYTYIHIYICVFIYLYVYIYISVYLCIYLYLCRCLHLYTYIYMNSSELRVKTRWWECDRPGVEPTSSGLHVWGQYHSSEKVSCDEWYWNPSPDISGYMCGARRVLRGLLLTTLRF